jgi:hypothetical protein
MAAPLAAILIQTNLRRIRTQPGLVLVVEAQPRDSGRSYASELPDGPPRADCRRFFSLQDLPVLL